MKLLNNKKVFILPSILLLIVLLAIIIFVSPTLKSFISDKIFGVDEHFLTCSQLPSLEKVNSIYDEHKDDISDFVKKEGGHFSIVISNGVTDNNGNKKCEGKADILVYFNNQNQRLDFKQKFGDNFFGVPYRSINL